MTTEQIINTLREYNAWRRDGESEMLDPKLIGKTIDAACDAMEELENHKASSIHTCHDRCKRPMCVLRRERDAERALADSLGNSIYRYLSYAHNDYSEMTKAMEAWKEARRE